MEGPDMNCPTSHEWDLTGTNADGGLIELRKRLAPSSSIDQHLPAELARSARYTAQVRSLARVDVSLQIESRSSSLQRAKGKTPRS